jgi:hypothetical protein
MANDITPAVPSEARPQRDTPRGLNHQNFLLVTPGSSVSDPKGWWRPTWPESWPGAWSVPIEFSKYDTPASSPTA